MALNLSAVRDALAAQLTTQLPGVRCYARIAGQMQLPACAVIPAEPYVERDQSMRAHHVRVRLDVAIVVRIANLEQGQVQLDGLIDDVVAAVLSDRTVAGTALDLHVASVTAPEDGELSGAQVLTCTVQVELMVEDN